MYAAMYGHTECVKLLLFEADAQCDDGNTAMMYAAEAGHVDCVRLLLQFEVGV